MQSAAPLKTSAATLQILLSACIWISAASGLLLLYLLAARALPGTLPAPSAGLRLATVILLSGAIGFVTNWLAIKMLFRPHRRIEWLIIWQQGLLPREHARFAAALGKVAADRLMSPEAVARGLADESLRGPLGRAIREEVDTLLAAPATRQLLTDYVTEGLRDHAPEVLRRLRPQLRAAIERALDEHLTAERMLGWVESAVRHFAASRNARRTVAKWIFEETASEGSLTRIMEILREQFARYRERHPVRGFLAEQFVIDWDGLRESLALTLRSDETTEQLADLLVDMAGSIAQKLRTPEASESVIEIRARLIERMLDWFETEGLASLVHQAREIADAPSTWSIVENSLFALLERIPNAIFDEQSTDFRPEVRDHLRGLQARLVKIFPIAEIVERQVMTMNPADVENMIDDIARRELAWIQILGLILGLIAGALMAVVL